MKNCLRRIRARVSDERGIALVMAVVTTAALTAVTGTVLYFTAASNRMSERTDADQQAYALAEAGINTAIAKIYGATDPRVTTTLPDGTVAHPATVVPKCPATNATETPTCYQTGSVTYKGSLNTSLGNTWYWTVTSTGSVPVAGVSTVNRTLTRSVGITGNNGTNGNSWTRFYQDSTSSCLTLDGVSVPTNFASRGDVCLINGATVTGSGTNMNAGGNIYIDPPEANAPTAGTGWNNSTRAYTSNNSYADGGALSNLGASANLDLTDLNYVLPSTATIQGIKVDVERKASANTSTNYINDTDVYLLKGGVTSGSDKALTTTKWPTTDGIQSYGSSTDLWGTTWTYSNVDATNFGVRIKVTSHCSGTSCTVTPSIDAVTVTVYYSAGKIGASGANIAEVDTGGGCQQSANAMHTTCSSADRVWATTVKTVAPADNTALGMPDIDWDYWYANAKPGPKHFCTNPNPGLATNFFDNNSLHDASLTVNGEMAPATSDFDCEVWENGVLQGEIKWVHTTHIFTIYGTAFVDGNFRFDEDGEIIHYFGRGTLMSSHDDEIDALVCAGGTGNTYATSCLGSSGTGMGTWSPSQNMMVLMSECRKGLTSCNEYDQGGSTCTGSPPSCYNGHLPAGFQGILYSKGDCLIHQNFQDSGPVICNTITMPNEGSGLNPTYYSFPSIGNLTDGMSYSDTASATDFTFNVSAQGDG
jgi:hypothetical protein